MTEAQCMSTCPHASCGRDRICNNVDNRQATALAESSRRCPFNTCVRRRAVVDGVELRYCIEHAAERLRCDVEGCTRLKHETSRLCRVHYDVLLARTASSLPCDRAGCSGRAVYGMTSCAVHGGLGPREVPTGPPLSSNDRDDTRPPVRTFCQVVTCMDTGTTMTAWTSRYAEETRVLLCGRHAALLIEQLENARRHGMTAVESCMTPTSCGRDAMPGSTRCLIHGGLPQEPPEQPLTHQSQEPAPYVHGICAEGRCRTVVAFGRYVCLEHSMNGYSATLRSTIRRCLVDSCRNMERHATGRCESHGGAEAVDGDLCIVRGCVHPQMRYAPLHLCAIHNEEMYARRRVRVPNAHRTENPAYYPEPPGFDQDPTQATVPAAADAMRCHAPSCLGLRPSSDTPYCNAHGGEYAVATAGRCATAGCTELRVQGSTQCGFHRRPRPRLGVCQHLGCRNATLPGSEYCASHYGPTCAEPGCGNTVVSSDTHCIAHRPWPNAVRRCTTPGCWATNLNELGFCQLCMAHGLEAARAVAPPPRLVCNTELTITLRTRTPLKNSDALAMKRVLEAWADQHLHGADVLSVVIQGALDEQSDAPRQIHTRDHDEVGSTRRD